MTRHYLSGQLFAINIEAAAIQGHALAGRRGGRPVEELARIESLALALAARAAAALAKAKEAELAAR